MLQKRYTHLAGIACFALAMLLVPYRGTAGESDSGGMGGFLGEGIDFKGGMLDWEEDDEGRRVAILRNYAVVLLPNLTISARNMVLNVEMQEIYAEGDVLFDEPTGNAFYCDQLTFNYQEWKGLAKNIRVKMDRVNVELPVRDFLDEIPSTSLSSGSYSLNESAGGELKRMYVQAQELRAHDAETFELIDAKITPSSFAKPHWYFRSPAALFRKKEKIESYHNTVNVGRLPVLYFPYLIRDLQYDWPWMRITVGRTGDYGYFARTQWGWRLNRNDNAYLRTDKIIFDLDYFSRRGTGVGLETTYQMGHWDSLGKLKIYGVYEHAISNRRDRKRAWDDNEDRIYRNVRGWKPSLYRNDFRWAIDWEHYQQLNEYWDVRAEMHLYHDRDYLKDYDPDRYWSQRESRNSIDVRRLDKQWELEFVAEHRLSNRWETQSAYYPEVRLTVPGIQLLDWLYLKNDFRMGFVNRYFDEDEYRYTRNRASGLFGLDDRTGLSTSRLLDRANYDTMFRAFNEMRLEAPIKLGFMTAKPWVGLRTAYYSDTLGTPYSEAEILSSGFSPADRAAYLAGRFSPGQIKKKGSGEANYAVPFGIDLSTRAYTLFGNHEQWRMITEPVVSYLENSKPHLDSLRDLYPIDYYDEYQRQRRLGLELHTKLQRRYYEDAPGMDIPQRNVLDFNIAFYHYPRKEDRFWVNGDEDRDFSEISTEIIYRPTQNLSFNVSVEYEPHESTFNRVIVGADWRLSSMFRLRANHYHYSGNDWRYPNEKTSSQTHVALRTKLWNDNSHYSLEGALGFEWRHPDRTRAIERDEVRHGFNKYRLTLFRDIDTFEMAISYIKDRNANDHGLFFSLTPKSFMGIERPPPTYTVDVETLADGRYPDSVKYLNAGYMIDAPVADADLKEVQF